MVNERMKALGETRSVIRDLFEYGMILKKERGAENVFDFSLGNPNVPAPECVERAVYNALDLPNVHNYTSAQGDASVRASIAEYNNKMWNVGLTANDIYMTSGAAAALTITLSALNCGEEEFIVIAPFFPEYKVFIETSGGKMKIASGKPDFSLDISEIEKLITPLTKGIIINSPNNPSGKIYAKSDIIALSALLRKKEEEFGTEIYLISDEPYREITYGKEVVNPMNHYDDTIICYSYSKTLSLAGERIGYIAVSPKARERKAIYSAVCGAGRALGYVCAPSLFQFAVSECLGKTSDLNFYRKNRDILYEMMKGLGFECVEPEGAFYLFVKCPCDPAVFFEECKKEGLLVVPSESFGTKGYVRIAYCVATDVIIRSAPHFEKVAEICGLKRN